MRYKNLLSELTVEETVNKYKSDLRKNEKIMVHFSNNTSCLLKDISPFSVEFIGGLWRGQKEFKYNIKTVRDKKFILGDKIERSELPREEIPIFDYYPASMVGINCYGYSIGEFDYIVANCGGAWGYGKTISDARAYLSSKVIDISTQNPKISKILLKEMKQKSSR
jgi:hypothetical protein